MANHGAGNKFVSVNLNKSYGKLSGPSNSTYGGGSRVRPGGQIGGGGGMVVLSRPRSSQKTGQKLSVPSPVNLPSMKKEHEKFDSSGAGIGSAGGAAGSSSRPSSAGMGWSKPAALVLQEKEKSTETPSDVVGGTMSSADGASRVGSVYMPPARSGSSADATGSSQLRVYTPAEKVAILRGEDFPSLHTSLSTGSGHTHKQKDGANQKSKQVSGEDLSSDRRHNANAGEVGMHPQGHTSHHNIAYGSSENDVGSQRKGGPGLTEESQKQESYFHGSLPEVRLNPRSDWPDDERDTGRVLTDRGRNHGSLNTEGYWDRDFEMPRGSFMAPKPAPNVFNKWGQRDSETGKMLSSEVFKADPFIRDARPTSKEGRDLNSWNNSESHDREGRDISYWRSSSASLIRAKPQGPMNSGNGFGAEPFNAKREMANDNRFAASLSRDRVDSFNDRVLDRKNSSSVEGGRQRWNSTVEPAGIQGSDRVVRDQFEGDRFLRHRSNSYQNGSPAKSNFSLGGKGQPVNDPTLNFSKVKKPLSKNEELSLEDPFTANGFDGRDPFSVALIGMVKRKKDPPKLTDFHDPARESFEAELERVQKMQEQERQRALEEQERAIELARREEQERLRLARDHEERERRLEEEAKEAAWRAEQERIEAIQKVEEQRIAREDEKQRMQMEEERRKQAAKQKLLELEEKIARRQAEATREDAAYAVDCTSRPGKEKETSRAADISDWEDGERMVERITTSASSNSSSLNRFIDSGSGPHSFADNSVSPGRGKSTTSWKRDAYDNERSSNFILHNQDNCHSSPRKDIPLHAKKSLPTKDVYGGSGLMYPQNYTKAGVFDPDMNGPFHLRGQKWNFRVQRDHYDSNTEIDGEAHERFTEKLDDAGWGESSSSHQTPSIYQERPYQNPDLDEAYSYSRSRYSMRQPRVFPPPSISSMNKSLNRGEIERPGLSTSLDRVVDSSHVRDCALLTGYDIVRQENQEDPEMVALLPGHVPSRDQLLKGNNSIRCDSQSSLSVSSPPSSPTHLSHEDLEDLRGTPDSSADADVKVVRPISSDSVIRNESFLTAADDEEWMVENRENLQEQEVYDEGGEYQEGDEFHAEEEDIDLNEGFEALNLEKGSPRVSENLILGFNEGIEVGMPSDDSEGNQNEKSKFSAPQSSHADSMQSDGHLRARSSTEMQMTEELTGDFTVQSNVDPPISTVSSSQPLPAFAAPSVSRMVTSSMSAFPNQLEVPVKLQMGLFSGSSLIGSPVPSIQIGSIQMPLHLHSPVGSSLPHQSGPLFHFGQLRYNSPIAQGILPLASQTVSFVQPGVPGQFANHNPSGTVSVQPVQQFSQSQNAKNRDALVNNQESFSQMNLSSTVDAYSLQHQGKETKGVVMDGPSRSSNTMETERLELDVKIDGHLQHDSAPSDPISSTEGGQLQSRVILPHQSTRERVMIRCKTPGPLSGGRRRENFSTSRNFECRSSNIASMAPHVEPNGSCRKPQRNGQQGENQIRDNADRRLPDTGDKMKFGLRGARMSSRNGPRKGVFLEKLAKQTNELDWLASGAASSKDITSGSKADKDNAEEGSIISHSMSRAGEVYHKRNIKEDIDVTLQSGLVRVYDQPGIEIPSDEDDFIKVRSKRQMLNDRREQREKESKAKFRVTKNIRKPRPTSQITQAPRNSSKISSSLARGPLNEVQSRFVATEGRSRVNAEVSAGLNSISASQPLAPIGTPSTNNDGHFKTRFRAVKPAQANELPVVSTGGKSVGPGFTYENKSNAMENVEASLGPWNSVWVSQQVMPLTQSQLDDALNPERFDVHGSSGKPSGSVGVPVSSSSSLMKDESFSPSASPINSLLAGKKIQFGAVTSPTILPPCSRAVSQGIGSLGFDQVSNELSASENECSLFNEIEKRPKEPNIHMEVYETTEAAASAVAVAASDVQGTGAGHSVRISDSERFGRAGDDGANNDQKSTNHSRTEESLSVSLPADLSIEMSPISLWQPLQSPQNASHHMLSHFPGGHPSHFPFYEMNPMAGGPIFAFGPHDNASGSQTQPQQNNTTVSGPLAPWQQQRHSGAADSFYGHPTGFAPFITQPGGIPGTHAPPHMVLYNHFAPVGQVGLSFLGTTYVPSEKQPDWKHNPTSSGMAVGEENANNMGMNSGQHVPHCIPAPIQHLVPGPSSLLQVAPPLAMFDVSPYQQSSDMSGPSRWPHLPSAPQLQQPLQPHPERLMSTAPTTLIINRFPDSQTASSNYPKTSSDPASQFPAELGLVESSSSAPPPDPSALTTAETGASRNRGGDQSMPSCMKSQNQSHQQKNVPFQQHSNAAGFNYQSRTGAGRRAGYHSRNQSSSSTAEKGFHHPAKVKQIYVPKQPAANLTS